LLNEKFVAAFQQVGSFRVSKPVDPRGKTRFSHLSKQGGNLVSYFCTPDMEVLHMLVGPVQPEALIEGARWALAAQQRITESGERRPERIAACREAHGELVRDETRKQFQLVTSSSVKIDASGSTATRAVAVADAVLAIRVGIRTKSFRHARKISPEIMRNWAKLQAHDPSSREFEHLFLGELALASLADIEKPVFVTLAGENYTRRKARSDELIKEFGAAKEESKPILMIVGASDPPLGLFDDQSGSSLLPLNRSGKRFLKSYRLIWLSEPELTLLLDELDQEPLDLQFGRKPRYVLFDRAGKRRSIVTDRDKPSELNKLLRETVAVSEPADKRRVETSVPVTRRRRSESTGR
jgi:hypothetical protein